MVLRCDVLAAAIDSVSDDRPLLALTPRGPLLTQQRVRELSQGVGAILLCGRFEGFDERIIEGLAPLEVSVGDYILSGGELAAMVVVGVADATSWLFTRNETLWTALGLAAVPPFLTTALRVIASPACGGLCAEVHWMSVMLRSDLAAVVDARVM